MSTKEQLSTLGRLSVACREDRGTPETRAAAQRDLAELRLERHIQRTLATAPPLTDEQRVRLASLPGGGAR